MDGRKFYQQSPGSVSMPVLAGEENYGVSVAAPILSEGDVLGAVLFLSETGGRQATDVEVKLAQTVALFLGKQMEN